MATGSCQKPQVPLVRQGSLKDSDFHQAWWFRGDIIWDIIDVELSWECGLLIYIVPQRYSNMAIARNHHQKIMGH